MVNLQQRCVSRFAQQFSGGARIVTDVTHNIGIQEWTLIGVGLLGVQHSRSVWQPTTILFGAFCMVTEDNHVAVPNLVSSIASSV